jgi:Domain of unknown function (DUF4340)
MVRRATWIMLLVFGGLVLFAWLFQRFQSNKTENAATATPSATAANLYNLNATQLVEITLSSSNGKMIDFTRDPESANWEIKDLPIEQADSFQIESVSSQLLSLPAIDTLTQSPPLDSIGLDNPSYTITMVTADGKQIVTYVGSTSAIGTGYYVRVDSGPVVIVDKVSMDDVLKLINEPPLLATATPEVTASGTDTPSAPAAQPTSTP